MTENKDYPPIVIELLDYLKKMHSQSLLHLIREAIPAHLEKWIDATRAFGLIAPLDPTENHDFIFLSKEGREVLQRIETRKIQEIADYKAGTPPPAPLSEAEKHAQAYHDAIVAKARAAIAEGCPETIGLDSKGREYHKVTRTMKWRGLAAPAAESKPAEKLRIFLGLSKPALEAPSVAVKAAESPAPGAAVQAAPVTAPPCPKKGIIPVVYDELLGEVKAFKGRKFQNSDMKKHDRSTRARALSYMVKAGWLNKSGAGRSTSYQERQ